MTPRKQHPQPSRYVAKPETEGVWNDGQIRIERFKLTITPKYVGLPDAWYVSCSPFFDLKKIGKVDEMTEEMAKATALAMLREELTYSLCAVDKAIGD